jgi:hypothetical protein
MVGSRSRTFASTILIIDDNSECDLLVCEFGCVTFRFLSVRCAVLLVVVVFELTPPHKTSTFSLLVSQQAFILCLSAHRRREKP